MNNVGCDIKLLVFWLENMEDFGKLPLSMFLYMKISNHTLINFNFRANGKSFDK